MADFTIKDGVGIIPEGTRFIPSVQEFRENKELTSVVIPDSVTSIEDYAFHGCTGLTSITIPDSVSSIGEFAFWSCPNLTNLVLPNNPRLVINMFAFAYCTSLTNITIQAIRIETGAFDNCNGLKSITIGDGVMHIGRGVFNSPVLESITVDKGNKVFDSRDNCNAVIKSDTSELIVGCANTVIPDSIAGIGDSAFNKCTGLKSITLPKSTTWIERYAFAGCTGLTNITIPDSVTEIGNEAFRGCTALTSINIPASVSKIYDALVFQGCTSLTSIVVDKDNEKYDSRDNCNAIIETESNTLICGCASTTIPESVTIIGSSAFSGSGVTSFTIPSSVTEELNCVFDDCKKLKSAAVLGAVKVLWRTFLNCTALKEVTLGAGIKKFKDAFKGCSALKTIYVPAKKADYYKKRLPEDLHGLIVELPAEKKAKKK